MVNSQLTKEISNAFKIDERVSPVPNAIPVVEVGLKATKSNVLISNATTNTTSLTIYTTPADQDFYLDYASYSYRSQAGSSVEGYLAVYIDGIQKKICWVSDRAGSDTTGNIVYSGKPLLIDRNSVIGMKMHTAEVTTSCAAVIIGFIDEVN